MKPLKRALLAVLITLFIVSETRAAYGETPAFRKFRRGFCNILTFYLEVGNQLGKANKEGGMGKAMSLGLVSGLVMSGARALTGVYEVLTFPVPLPPGYEPILKDPEFFWTEPFAEGPKETGR